MRRSPLRAPPRRQEVLVLCANVHRAVAVCRLEQDHAGVRRSRDLARASGGTAVDASYEMTFMRVKIGMYSAMIIDPMMAPMTTIISGSMRAVRASVVASTSWS